MRKHWKRWLGIVAGLIVLLGFLFWPTGDYLEVPGSAESLKSMVQVAGTKDTHKGSYMLVTVGVVGPATPALLLWGKFQPFSDVVSKKDLMGTDNSAEYNLLQQYYIKSAANDAIISAFKAAKKKVTIKNLGIYVMSIVKNSPFKGKLKLGDTITAVNGKHYTSATQYVNAIKAMKIGAKVTLTFTRAGKTHHATAKLMRLAGTDHAGIGISLTEHTTVKTTPKVTIDAGNIGGPSAGLMFAIQTYTLITGNQYRHGQKIAGTGEIDENGNVEQIGGIDKKVYIANKRGAKVFFAPDEPATKAILKIDPSYQNNYTVAKQTAKKIGTKMKIVPVKTLNDALTYLRTH